MVVLSEYDAMRSSLRCTSRPENMAVPERTVGGKTANENAVRPRQAAPASTLPVTPVPGALPSDSPRYVSPYLRQPLRSLAEAEAEIADQRRMKTQKPSSPRGT